MEADIEKQGVGVGDNNDYTIMRQFVRDDINVKSVILKIIAC